MLDEKRIKILIKLIKDNEITVSDIKDADYKAEVESRLGWYNCHYKLQKFQLMMTHKL